ncbi:MAG: porin family protein [Endomicrobium sp.]|jgi:hypothetical protein|nr:porin family protein [Endomicrobium sp.]
MKKLQLSLLLVFVVAASCFAAAPKKTVPAASSKKAVPTQVSLNGGKFALGYVHNGFGLSVAGIDSGNSLSARYNLGPSVDRLSVEGSLGFVAGDGPEFFAVGAKGLYDLKRYPSFDIYVFAGADYTSADIGNTEASTSFFALSGGAGIEYFILGNLSVSTEFGLGAVFGDNHTSFGSFGNWLSNLGIRYYFDI